MVGRISGFALLSNDGRVSMKATSNQQESDLPKMSQPARRALASIGIERLKQLTKVSEAEIMQLHGMGPKALGELRRAMADMGLSFSDGKKK